MRVTCKQYRPDHTSMTTAAGIFNKILVAAPFTAMVFIGAGSRVVPQQYDFVAESPTQEAAIQAYYPIAKQTTKLVQSSRTPSPVALRQLAAQWLDGFKAGRYQLLTPIAYDDSTRDGPKGEILRSAVSLGEELDTVIENGVASHHYGQALSDAALTTRLVEALKYSDFCSLGVCSMVERRTLGAINELYPHLNAPQKTQVNQILGLMRIRDKDLADMAQVCRAQFLVYEVRRGYDKSQLTATQHYLKSGHFTDMAGIRWVTQQYRHRSIANPTPDDLIPDLVGSVRLGFVAAEDTAKAIDSIGKAQPHMQPSVQPEYPGMDTL